MIKIFNEDCLETMKRFPNNFIDVILTSPPYNTGRPTTSQRGRDNNDGRYDIHLDNMTQAEYCQWCIEIFNSFDRILIENGVAIWNVSYGSDASINTEGIGLVWLSIADIIRNTDFTVADRIIWKKKSAIPNNVSPNKLTRIVEDIFVFCRKSEYKTFNANKEISGIGKNGQTFYKNYYNFVEAKNNDGTCPLNKATYSSELCIHLLSIYAKENATVYDPFMGTGTTAVACQKMGFNCFGSELSADQITWAYNRLNNIEQKNEK